MSKANWDELKQKLYEKQKAIISMKNIETDMLEYMRLLGKEEALKTTIGYIQEFERGNIKCDLN